MFNAMYTDITAIVGTLRSLESSSQLGSYGPTVKYLGILLVNKLTFFLSSNKRSFLGASTKLCPAISTFSFLRYILLTVLKDLTATDG